MPTSLAFGNASRNVNTSGSSVTHEAEAVERIDVGEVQTLKRRCAASKSEVPATSFCSVIDVKILNRDIRAADREHIIVARFGGNRCLRSCAQQMQVASDCDCTNLKRAWKVKRQVFSLRFVYRVLESGGVIR